MERRVAPSVGLEESLEGLLAEGVADGGRTGKRRTPEHRHDNLLHVAAGAPWRYPRRSGRRRAPRIR